MEILRILNKSDEIVDTRVVQLTIYDRPHSLILSMEGNFV